MKIKPSSTRKVNIKPPTTKKVNPNVIAEALGAELICGNCHAAAGKHSGLCYKGMKDMENVLCGPHKDNDNEEQRKQKEIDNYWIRQAEIKKILSETDPQKYPNSIPEKTLSPEEQLEFIHEIVSELRMDFSDAEHQIDYHADTLADNYRDLMKAMDKIHHTLCMSVEQMNKMNW